MQNKNQDLFKKFFNDYSKNVDNANSQHFWKLSDEIILGIIVKHLATGNKKESIILDAGGGTGRWIQILSKKYHSKFILYDKSNAMLDIAKNKIELQKLGNRLQIVNGDIQNLKEINNNSIDYIISIYNPISFIEKPSLFFKEIKRILKPKGKALIMGQGFFNAIASKINNYLAEAKELDILENKNKVKWTSSVPELTVFSKELFEKLAKNAKLIIIEMYGIPVFVQPGPEDFDSENKKKSLISTKLEKDLKFYKCLYDLEMKYNFKETMINRGMNIMVVVQKR